MICRWCSRLIEPCGWESCGVGWRHVSRRGRADDHYCAVADVIALPPPPEADGFRWRPMATPDPECRVLS